MKINSHVLVHADDAGNGYHGYCAHCKIPLVTDLGYCSWDNTTCVDREIKYDGDIPKEILRYAEFCGYRWDNKKSIFIKPSFNKDLNELTLDQMNEKLKLISI